MPCRPAQIARLVLGRICPERDEGPGSVFRSNVADQLNANPAWHFLPLLEQDRHPMRRPAAEDREPRGIRG